MSGRQRLPWPSAYKQPALPRLPARWTGAGELDIPTPEIEARRLSVTIFTASS